MTKAVTPADPWFCAFCTKTRYDVRKLIVATPAVGICDECVGLCVDILVADGFPDALYDHRSRAMIAGDIGVDAAVIV